MKLSRTATGLLAVALMAFMVSDALGQGRRGQGGPGGQGGLGRGGPGGAGGPGGFGGRGGPGGFGGGRGGSGDLTFVLLRVEPVKEEIELMPDQEEAIGKITARSNDRGQQGDGPRFDFRNATEAERDEMFAKMREEREARTKKMREQLEEVLLPQQMERLDEIALQLRGVDALRDEKVAAKLKITEGQKKELEEMRDQVRKEQEEARNEMRAKVATLFQGGGEEGQSREEIFAKVREDMQQMRKDAEKKIVGVLNSSQQKEFEEMKGEPFEMPEDAMRTAFGGGRGGPGGFGGRGGGPGGGRGGPGGAGRGGPGGGRGPGGRGGDGGPRRQRPEAEE